MFVLEILGIKQFCATEEEVIEALLKMVNSTGVPVTLEEVA